jgi:hypothetical protein
VGAALVLISPAPASAQIHRCPKGKKWDKNQGACKKRAKAKAKSKEKKFEDAIKYLEAKKPKVKKALNLLKSACKSRHGESCTLIGFLYLNGEVVKLDAKKSLEYYGKGCKHKDVNGCIGAADVHSRGLEGRAVDHAKAIPFLEKACNMSSGRGCYRLGEKYEAALGVAYDQTKANELFFKAFELLNGECPSTGDVDGVSCYLIGEAYYSARGVEYVDKFKAYEAYDRGCTAGSGDACFELGISVNMGNGTNIDKPAAMKIFHKACYTYDNGGGCREAGVLVVLDKVTHPGMDQLREYGDRACALDKRRCDLLGYLFASGDGGTKDEVKGREWYTVSCDNGAVDGCRLGGDMYYGGQGGAKDVQTAVNMWRRECDLGGSVGCQQAAEQLYLGTEVTLDSAAAFDLFHLGCIRGDGKSCYYGGFQLEMGFDGSGVAKPEESWMYYEEGCNLAYGDACNSYASQLRHGTGIAKDETRAFQLYDQSCTYGNYMGCTEAGRLYFDGIGVQANKVSAGGYFEKACEFGDTSPCWWIDQMYREGDASDVTKQRGLDTLDRACNSATWRNEEACLVLGLLYAYGGYMTDAQPKKGFDILEAGCYRGTNGLQCVELASLYANGIGVVRNASKAKDLFTTQCDAGNPSACRALAYQLRDEKKFKDAAALNRRACDDGDAQACNGIGFAHYTAEGVTWDVSKAMADYTKACDLGLTIGCANMGELTFYGIGVPQDYVKARGYYEKACTPTDAVGCARLGHFYEKGHGVDVDIDRAEKEYKRGCDQADYLPAEACRWLAELYRAHKKGTASEIAKLTQRAQDYAKQTAETNPYGKLLLGLMYRDGFSVVKDPEKATGLFQEACEGYDPIGCMRAGEMNMGKHGQVANYEASAVYYDKACAAGVDIACKDAEAARVALANPPKDPTDPLDPVKPQTKTGCCDANPTPASTAGALLMTLLVVALLVRRRETID